MLKNRQNFFKIELCLWLFAKKYLTLVFIKSNYNIYYTTNNIVFSIVFGY